MCVVDDAQWLDRPSADALAFAARRLEAEGVVLLFAARDGEVRHFEGQGLPELSLGGLGAEAAGALLAERVPSRLSPEVRDRLVESAGGNPLALIELAGLLSAEQLAGRAPLPDPLPHSAQIEQIYLERARGLAGGGAAAAPARRGRRHRQPGDRVRRRLRPGHRARSPRCRGGGGPGARVPRRSVEFRHPLVRSTLYARCHLRAAAGRPPGARGRVRRRAGRGSPRVAPGGGLARARTTRWPTSSSRRRGGRAAGAVSRPPRARSSARPSCRATTRPAGAGSWRPHRTPGSPAVPIRRSGCSNALAGSCPTSLVRAELMHLRGTIELRCGVPAEAATILAAGAAEVAPVAPAKAIEMLAEAAQAASYAGDAAQIVEFGRRASALPADGDPDRRFTVDGRSSASATCSPATRRAARRPSGRRSASRTTSRIRGAWFTPARAPATRGGGDRARALRSRGRPGARDRRRGHAAVRARVPRALGGGGRPVCGRGRARHRGTSARAARPASRTPSATCSRRWR